MTIFVWFLLVVFVIWFTLTTMTVVSILMESDELVGLKIVLGKPYGLHLGRAVFNTVVPFIGIGACIGYLLN